MPSTADNSSKHKKTNKKDITRLLKWLLVLCLVFIVGALIVSGISEFLRHSKLSKAADVSKSFIADVKGKNYEAAYGLLSSDYKKSLKQSDLKSIAGTQVFRSALEGTEKIGTKKLSNKGNLAFITINFATSSGTSSIHFTLQNTDGQWRINGVATQ